MQTSENQFCKLHLTGQSDKNFIIAQAKITEGLSLPTHVKLDLYSTVNGLNYKYDDLCKLLDTAAE